MSLAVGSSIATSGRGVLSTSVPLLKVGGDYTNRPIYYEQWRTFSNLDADNYTLRIALPSTRWSTQITGVERAAITFEVTLFDDNWERGSRSYTKRNTSRGGTGVGSNSTFNLRAGRPSFWAGRLSNQLSDGDIRMRMRMWISEIQYNNQQSGTRFPPVFNGPETGYEDLVLADGGLNATELAAFNHATSGYQWTITVTRPS